MTADVLPHADGLPGSPDSASSLLTGRVLAALVVSTTVACLWSGPLRWTGWLAAFAVATHAAVCLRSGNGSVKRPSDFRGLKELALSGGLASLGVWLVMVTGVREACQLNLFDNIYFPYLRGDEVGYGWRLWLLYAGVTSGASYVYIRHRVLPGQLGIVVAPAILLLFFHTIRFSPEVTWSAIGNATWDLLRVVTVVGIAVLTKRLWENRDSAELPVQRRWESWLVVLLVVGAIAPMSSNLLAGRMENSVIVTSTFLMTFFVVCLSLFAWYWKRRSDSGWPVAILMLALGVFLLVGPEQLLAIGIGRVSSEDSEERVLVSAVGVPDEVQVYANGVLLGDSPVDMSLANFMSLAPSTSEFHDEVVTNAVPTYISRNDRFELKGRSSLRQHERVRVGDHVINVYFGLRFNGSPMQTMTYSSSRNSGGGAQVRLAWRSPEWQIQLGTLVDIARLQGYTVGAEWCEAFASYGDRGWVRIELESKDDPLLKSVQDAVVRHVFAISPEMSSGAAWQCMERIAGSTTQLPYLTDSYRGRAVELLAEHLDVNQLADHVVDFLRDENPAFLRRSARQTNSTDSIRFSTGQQRSKAGGGEDQRAFWHAAVATDRVLDSNGSKSNPLESRVVPELIRHVLLGGDSRYNAMFRARLIGGAEFDTFLLRHDWEAEVVEPENPYELESSTTARFGTRYINRWLHELLTLDSEAGRRFRREHEALIIALTASSLVDPPKKKLSESDRVANMVAGLFSMNLTNKGELPKHLMFLFLDPAENDEQSLAMKFWPEFCRHVDETRMLKDQQRLAPKLAYLSRMWPEPTEDMFVQLVVDHMDSVSTYIATMKPFLNESLDDEVRFRLLEQIKQATAEKAMETALADKSLTPENVAERWRRCFHDYQMRLNCLQSSELIHRNYIENWSPEKLEERLDSTVSFQRNSHIVATFARADLAKFRIAALDAILNVPMPDRMPLLQALQDDRDEQVAVRAQEVRRELDSLPLLELPHCSLRAIPLAAASNR